jgi:hypothetical protein
MHPLGFLSIFSLVDVTFFSRLKQEGSFSHGIKYASSLKDDNICEIDQRVPALSFHTKKSFESIKILQMARGPFSVDLIITICVIGVCFEDSEEYR